MGDTASGQERAAIREDAIRFTMSVLRNASDWQEGQHALFEHDRFGDWLRSLGDDDVVEANSIVREAEDRLGDQVPY